MLRLKKPSLKWALKSLEQSDAYLFPGPFEFDAISSDENQLVQTLANRDVLDYDKHGVRPYRSFLVPKSPMGFRIATQLDPIDTILTNAALYEIAHELEAARSPSARTSTFSYRLKTETDDGQLYDPAGAWWEFHTRTKEIAESSDITHVVVTDIADFYPSIYLHHAETVLYEAVSSSDRQTHAEFLLNYVRHMNHIQTHKGLPIGPIFSAPIAELVLDTLDSELAAKGVVFTRYLDDIRIFCRSEGEAYKELAHVADFLYQQRHFRLNENKTDILERGKFNKRYAREHDPRVPTPNFDQLVEALNLQGSPYSAFSLDELDAEELEQLKNTYWEQLLNDELKKRHIDYGRIAFVLNILSALGNTDVVDTLLAPANLRKLVPRLSSIVQYLERVAHLLEVEKRGEVSGKLLNALSDDVIPGYSVRREKASFPSGCES
ncbi:MAG: RNA-directed DNA polymerase, partial [Spirochaetaceae bacterium]|nr:RNA-directed DNA polymerase [Spirochaetaceae bacterium]